MKKYFPHSLVRAAGTLAGPAGPGDISLAHALARLGFGINIALHGWMRVPHIFQFASGLQKEFAGTFLPGGLIYPTGLIIVIGEALIGVLLVLGLFLRGALVAGALLMILLLFGVCVLQKWEIAGLQLTYLAFYAALLATLRYDRFSLDEMLRKCISE